MEMCTTRLFILLCLVTQGLAVGGLAQRADSCTFTSSCPHSVTPFCSSYLSVDPRRYRTTTTVTESTAYVYATSTITTYTSSCSTPTRKHINSDAAMRARGPTPAVEEAATATAPPCLASYTTASSALSSACSCFSITPFTRTKYVYTTFPNAPTVTTYYTTMTQTILTTTPTCSVSYTAPKSGKTTNWVEYLGVCQAFSLGCYQAYIFRNSTLTLCDALEKCAAGASEKGGNSFELSLNQYGGENKPAWHCIGCTDSPPNYTTYFPADNWFVTYEYKTAS